MKTQNQKSEMNFFQVDETSMSEKTSLKLKKLREAQKQVSELKKDFEASFTNDARKAEILSEEFDLMFSYKFGKLSVARVSAADREKPKTPAKKMFSF